MWDLKELLTYCQENKVELNGKWVPTRPLNYRKEYLSLGHRIKRAISVFTCKTDVFIWPEDQ
jgi:hypothetical protein